MLQKLPIFLNNNNAKLLIKYDGERNDKKYTIRFLYNDIKHNSLGGDTDSPYDVLKDILFDALEKNDSYEWIDPMERIEFKEVIKQFRDRLDTILVELKYPSAKTINKLTKELKLKETNDYTQDWEFEVANINQLSDYIEYYQSGNLNINEKTTLMRIILEAYNEFLSIENKPDICGEKIKEFLKRDYSIYHEIIEYWACEGEESDNCFVLTPFIRNIKETQKQ